MSQCFRSPLHFYLRTFGAHRGDLAGAAGKGDEVAAYLSKIRAAAESAAEPDTLTYRTTRHEENADKFLVFEEYKLPNGILDHGESGSSCLALSPSR